MLTTSRGAQGAGTLRRLNAPRPVKVRATGDGPPSALLHDGAWLPVEEVVDRYRTDDRWWTAEPIARMYCELLLADGRTVTVFYDEVRDRWYEQRYG